MSLIAAAATLLVAFVALPAEAAGASCGFRSPTVPALEVPGTLLAAAGSASNAWAVGTGADGAALRAHWNGRDWAVVPGPDPGVETILEDVAIVSPQDAWAVGAAFDGTDDHRLIQRWDGRRWTTVPQPPSPGLLGVNAFGPSDAWAVGEVLAVLHWDGATWTPVPHPPLEEADFHAVAGAAPDDAWIVGAQESEGAGDHTFAMHWNGSVLSSVPLPVIDADESELLDVAVISSDDVWAVGEQDLGTLKRTLAEHWDGTSWSVVPTPNPGADLDELTAVSAVSSTDVWAAGTWAEGGIEHPLIVHWDGTRWSRVPAQPPSHSDAIATLEGLAALSPSQVLAVGGHGPSDTELQPLLEVSRSCGR